MRRKQKLYDQKTVKTVAKMKSSKKKINTNKEKPGIKKEPSSGYQARKNYIKLIKHQRIKREKEENKNIDLTKNNSKNISQKSIIKKKSYDNTIELEMDDSNVFGSDEELIEIMDELQAADKNKEAKKGTGNGKLKRKETTKKIIQTRQSSKESNGTLKTSKRIFQVETESSKLIEANKRTTDKKLWGSKKEIQIKKKPLKSKINDHKSKEIVKKNCENKASIDLDFDKKNNEEKMTFSIKQNENLLKLSPKNSTYTSTQFKNEKIIKLKPKKKLQSSKKIINCIQSERKIGNLVKTPPAKKSTSKTTRIKHSRNSKSSTRFQEIKLNSYKNNLPIKKPLDSNSKINTKKEYEPIKEIPEQEVNSERKEFVKLKSKKKIVNLHKKTQSTVVNQSKDYLRPGNNLKEPHISNQSSNKNSLYSSELQTYSSKYNSNISRKSKISNGSKKRNQNKNKFIKKRSGESQNRTLISSYFKKAKKKQDKIKKSTKNINNLYAKEIPKTKKQFNMKSSRIITQPTKSNKTSLSAFKHLSKSSVLKKPKKKLLSTSALHKVKTSKKSTTKNANKKPYSEQIKKASTKSVSKSAINKLGSNTVKIQRPIMKVINKADTYKNIYDISKSKNLSQTKKVPGRINHVSLKKKILKKGQNKYMDLLEIKRMKKDLAKVKVAPFNLYQPISYKTAHQKRK
jgi:hypothetical protein